MDLEELRAVQTRERATDGLQELRESFYADVATYIQELRDERDRVAAESDDPFRNPRVNELSDEIEVAEQVAEAIYERRIGKLVKQASLAAAGMPDDQTGLTNEEQDLYTDLVERIRENKQGVLDVIAGEAPIESGGDGDEGSDAERGEDPGEPDTSDAPTPPPDEPPEDTASSAAEVMGGNSGGDGGHGSDEQSSTDEAQDTHDAQSVERTTVRVTSDIGEIFGVDEREYSLFEDDVVQLPEENAEPLLQRDAAERLE